MSAPIRALKARAVALKCGQTSTRWVWARLKSDPEFPRPFYIAAHVPMWLEHELDKFLELQASRRNEPRKVRFDRQRAVTKESSLT